MTMTTLSSEGRLRALCGGMIKRNRSNMLYFGVLLFVLYPLQYVRSLSHTQVRYGSLLLPVTAQI